MNWDCITVKGIRFIHQTIFNGAGDGVHCYFCGREWESKEQAEESANYQRTWLRLTGAKYE